MPLKRIRWVTELLFSANLVPNVLLVVSVRSPYQVTSYLLYPGRILVSILYRILPVPQAIRETDLNIQYFLGSVAVLSAFIFLVFRITSRLAISELLLRHLAGIAGIVAFPLAQRYSGGIRLVDHAGWMLNYWLQFELLAAVVLTIIYQFSFLQKNRALMLSLLAAHFVLWGWVMRPAWFWPVYPMLGLAASMMWGVYLQRPPAATSGSQL